MKIVDLLGGKAEYYLNHTCKTIDKQLIHIPGPDMIDKVWMNSDRNIRTLESLQALYGHGRLANTGYVPYTLAETLEISDLFRVIAAYRQ